MQRQLVNDCKNAAKSFATHNCFTYTQFQFEALCFVFNSKCFMPVSPPPSSFGGFSPSPTRLGLFFDFGFLCGQKTRYNQRLFFARPHGELAGISGGGQRFFLADRHQDVMAAGNSRTFMKTFSAKAHEVQRDWFVIDATDKVLGRVASEVARRLRGKHKPEFTPHVDTGDFIIVVNAARLRVTGNKPLDKKYYRHSGYPGGIYRDQLPEDAVPFPGPCAREGRQGHVAQGPARLRHDQEAQGVCRVDSPAHCPATTAA